MRTAPKAPLSMISCVRRIGASIAVAVTDAKLYAGRLRRLDHVRALRKRQRHRLFHQHVLAVARGENRVLGVQSVRRRDVNDVDAGIAAQRVDRRVRARAELGDEPIARLGARVGSRRQPNARVADERRQHQRERAPEAGHAPAQNGPPCRAR
jgi:hypothetical protein